MKINLLTACITLALGWHLPPSHAWRYYRITPGR